jgi:hypothetical protein
MKTVDCARGALRLGAVCLLAAWTQAALAYGGAGSVHSLLVPAACAGDCAGEAGSRGAVCASEGCEADSPSRLASLRKDRLASQAQTAARTSAVAPSSGAENLFVGAGDMSAGSWIRGGR